VQTLQYIRLPELKDRFISAEPINGFTVQDGDKKRGKPLNLADAWLAWPDHAQKFGGVDFYPNPKQCPRNVYNLFKGYNVTPAAGNVAPYLELVEGIVCGGNKEHAAYVLDFLAHMFQKPEQKPSVAIVMKGGRGIGKGSFVWPLIRIMGMHGAHLTGVNQAAGRFNSVIVGKLLMFFDEMHVTTRDAEDALKTIISEPMISMERKGIDPEPVSNYARVIGASNHADVIRTGEKERRYLLLESSDHRAGDKAYWDSYYQWARAGGASHLLAYLLKRDISAFNPHFAPRTAALQAAMVEDLTPVNRYILEQLREEIPFALAGDEFADLSVGGKALPGGEIPTEAVAVGYLEFLNERYPKRYSAWNIDHARNQLKGLFTKLDIAIAGRKGKGYGRKYIIESFEDMRHAFADLIGVDYSAAFNDGHE
jgi:putative DNA primase/helicase